MSKKQGIPCYKIVRRLRKDGRLISSWINTTWPDGSECPLEYKEGELTTAPKHTPGVFCYRSLSLAKRFADVCNHERGTAEVHEALGFGREIDFWSNGFPQLVNYKKIRLGKCVAKRAI